MDLTANTETLLTLHLFLHSNLSCFLIAFFSCVYNFYNQEESPSWLTPVTAISNIVFWLPNFFFPPQCQSILYLLIKFFTDVPEHELLYYSPWSVRSVKQWSEFGLQTFFCLKVCRSISDSFPFMHRFMQFQIPKQTLTNKLRNAGCVT